MFSLLNGVIIIPCKDPSQSNELSVHWAMHSKWRNLSFWNLTNGIKEIRRKVQRNLH